MSDEMNNEPRIIVVTYDEPDPPRRVLMHAGSRLRLHVHYADGKVHGMWVAESHTAWTDGSRSCGGGSYEWDNPCCCREGGSVETIGHEIKTLGLMDLTNAYEFALSSWVQGSRVVDHVEIVAVERWSSEQR